MVMVEALACGTPVVATPMGAVPEIVDDGVTGFVRSGEGALAETLLAVGGPRPREMSSGRGRAVLRQRMVADHVALYDSLIYGDAIPLVA